MPAPHVTATPQPLSTPARRTAKVSLPTIIFVAPATRFDLRLEDRLLVREVEPCEEQDGEVGPAAGLADQASEHVEAARDAEVMGRALAAAGEG